MNAGNNGVQAGNNVLEMSKCKVRPAAVQQAGVTVGHAATVGLRHKCPSMPARYVRHHHRSTTARGEKQCQFETHWGNRRWVYWCQHATSAGCSITNHNARRWAAVPVMSRKVCWHVRSRRGTAAGKGYGVMAIGILAARVPVVRITLLVAR